MIEPPRLPRKLPLEATPDFGDDSQLESMELDAAAWAGLRARRSSLHRVRLVRADLIGADMRQSGLIDVELSGVIASGLIAVEGLWRRVRARSCRIDGLIVYSAQWIDVEVVQTRLDQANLRSVRGRNLVFRDSSLREVDFSGATLRSVSFDGCDLTGANFTGARLKNVDLRRAHFEYLASFSGLRGALMTYAQVVQLAPQLARQVGILIDDEVV